MTWICRDEGFPAARTVSDWKKDHPAFATAFARAREEGFDAIAAECLQIADDVSRDTISTEKGEAPNSEWIARSRVRIDTRLKLLAKWSPKTYGDQITATHEVGDSLQALYNDIRKK